MNTFHKIKKKILRETWMILGKQKQKHGEDIFIRIFEKKPVTKQLFPFRDVEGEDLLRNPLFCSHAKRFMHAIEITIQNLDALDVALVPVLYRLGEKHGWIDGFKKEYLPVFTGSIQEVFAEALGTKCTKQVREAWGHLGRFIGEKMHEGYLNAQVARKKSLVT